MAVYLARLDGSDSVLLVDERLLAAPYGFELREMISLASASPIPADDVPAGLPVLVWQAAGAEDPAFAVARDRLLTGRAARVLRIGAAGSGVDFDAGRLHVSAALCRRRIVSRPEAELRLADGLLAPLLRWMGRATTDQLWSVLRDGEGSIHGLARRPRKRAAGRKVQMPPTSLLTFGRVRLGGAAQARLVLACQMSGLDVRDPAGRPHPARVAHVAQENAARLAAAQAALLHPARARA